MVTRCLPLGNPLESRFCVLAYTHLYVYTCIILHREERGECSSIVSPSVVVLLTPLYISLSLLVSLTLIPLASLSLHRLLDCFIRFSFFYISTLSLSLFLKPFTSLDDFDPFGYGQFFFSPKPQKCQSTPGACWLAAKGELIISPMQALKNILFNDRD